jgi:hypothetical protein
MDEMLLKSALIVHKIGARLVEILDKPPDGWYGDEEQDRSEEDGGDTDADSDGSGDADADLDRDFGDASDIDKDDDEWHGVVKWTEIPFSTGGGLCPRAVRSIYLHIFLHGVWLRVCS